MIDVSGERPLRIAEIQRALRQVDSSALLVPYRLVRRVIRHDCGLLDFSLRVPHEKCYRIKTDSLLRLATREELGLEAGDLPPSVILLVSPSEESLERTPRERVLLQYWRLLFHARIHVVLEERWARGELTLRGLNARIEAIGATEFQEAGTVLDLERFILPPGDQRNRFIEFVAVYLELHYFASTLIPYYFPSVRDPAALAAALDREVGAVGIFRATRLAGAPDPCPPTETMSEEPVAFFRKLVRDADEAGRAGNLVRAAILRTRAARVAPGELEAPTRRDAQRDLFDLVNRLRGPLDLDPERVRRWREVLLELLDKSDQGNWPQEARLLFDLEKACIEWERQLYRVSVVRWIVSRRLREPLPHQKNLLVHKHLQKAYSRLPAVRLTVDERKELNALLREGLEHVETRLRSRLRPLVGAALRESGLVASGPVEEESLETMVDGLLDRIAERSFLTFGDVRDAVSGNQVKIGDLTGIRELVRGDTLLEIDRRLGTSLIGVYRPGEVYRRWLQGLSSLVFGTGRGRSILRLLLLPLAGSFGFLVALGAVLHTALSVVSGGSVEGPRLARAIPVGVLALVLAILINHARIRERVFRAVHFVRFHLRGLLVDIPVAVGRLPQVRRIVRQEWFVAFVRAVVRPLVLTIAITFGLAWFGRPLTDPVLGSLLIFLGSAWLLNSRSWRSLEEALEDGVLRGWRYLRRDFVPGLYRALMRFFKRMSEGVEALVYTVDEWLRFRAGEGRLSLFAKAFLAPLWAPVNYTLRFGFDAFIEPRINPIKYVSVVLIIDKITIPLTPAGLIYFRDLLSPLGAFLSNTLAWFVLYAIPAFVGFIVWELKENWRLYRANRPLVLSVQPMKLHGKTLPQVLHGGGVSTNLPALFAKLRRAERRAHRTGNWVESRQHRAALEDLRSVVRLFIDRELLRPLARSRTWGGVPLVVRQIQLGLSRIRVEIGSDSYPGRPIVVVFEADASWLVASLPETGFLETLGPAEVKVFRVALAGLYKKAGVELVLEQVESYLREFQALSLDFSFAREGLKVWPAGELEASAVYDLQRWGPLRPEPIFGQTPVALPTLEATRLLFTETEIVWEDFVRAWREEQEGREPALASLLPVSIDPRKLPAEPVRTSAPLDGGAAAPLPATPETDRGVATSAPAVAPIEAIRPHGTDVPAVTE